MKTFTKEEMELAITELEKVWKYEKARFNFMRQAFPFTEKELKDIDSQEISYGINLGTLRELFQDKWYSQA